MATPNRAVFKYKHDDSGVTPLGILARVGIYVAVVVLLFATTGPFAFFLSAAGLLALFVTWPKKRLSLGPRYLLCGNTVVYYANVRKMDLRPGMLELRSASNEVFTLDHDRFPTNARKDWKIRKNKTEKFNKVSTRIIERVLHAAPAVECRGIDRARYQVPS